MSVAFRRESDEEHLEPKFELPIPPGPNLVTSRGLALIEATVGKLEAALAAAPDEASGEPLRRELRYWHTRRTTAELAPAPAGGEIGIGSRVTVALDGGERTIEIVGADEAEPGAGRLSFHAPLARALIGAGEGDRIAFNRGEVEVLAVEGI